MTKRKKPRQPADPDRASTDLFIKALLNSHLIDLAAWLWGERPEKVSPVESLLARVTCRVTDKVFCLRFRDQPPVLLHVEFQLRGDPAMGERMAIYAILLRRYQRAKEFRDCRVANVVVYLDPSVYKEDPGHIEIQADPTHGLRFSYRVVKLWELDPEPFLAKDAPGLWPLVPFLRGKPEELLVQSKKRIVGAPESVLTLEEKRELLAITSGLSARVVRETEVLDRLVLEIQGMGTNYVFDKLIEQGRQEGREVGRREAARSHVLRVLRRRFCEAGEDVEARLAAVEDTETLESLLEEAAAAPSLEAFIARFLG